MANGRFEGLFDAEAGEPLAPSVDTLQNRFSGLFEEGLDVGIALPEQGVDRFRGLFQDQQEAEQEEDLTTSLLTWEGITDIPEEVVGGAIEGLTGLKFGRPETGVGKAVRAGAKLGGVLAAFAIPAGRAAALGTGIARSVFVGTKLANAAPVIGAALGGAAATSAVAGGQKILSGIQEGRVDPKEVAKEAGIIGGLSLAFPVAGTAIKGVSKLLPNWGNPLTAMTKVLPRSWRASLGYQLESPSRRFIGLTPHVEDLITTAELHGLKSAQGNLAIANVLDDVAGLVRGAPRTRERLTRLATKMRDPNKPINYGTDRFTTKLGEALEVFPQVKLANNLKVPPRTKQLLIWLQEFNHLERQSGKWFRKWETKARGAISHIMLGFGRPSAALVNFTQMTNVLAKEGTAATAWAWERLIAKDKLWKKAFELTVGKGQRGLEQKLGLPDILKGAGKGRVKELTALGERASLSFFLQAENLLRPMAFMARYYNVALKKGLNPTNLHKLDLLEEGLKQGVRSARETQFNYFFDLPAALRKSGPMGSAIRTHLQFFPFALKQAEFVTKLGLRDFTNYMGYFVSLAGVRGVPFSVAADRFVAFFTGKSALDAILADPRYEDGLKRFVVAGAPGLAGIDIARRVDWTADLADRILGMNDSALFGYVTDLSTNLEKFIENPTKFETWMNLAKTVSPRAWQDGIAAFEAASIDEFVGRTERTVLESPTEAELGARAAGFQPLPLSRARAVQRVISGQTRRFRRSSGQLGEALKLAIRRDDINDIEEILIEAKERGMNIRTLKKNARLRPSVRLARQLPKSLRTPENIELIQSLER